LCETGPWSRARMRAQPSSADQPIRVCLVLPVF
jgi:hypothetical protein